MDQRMDGAPPPPKKIEVLQKPLTGRCARVCFFCVRVGFLLHSRSLYNNSNARLFSGTYHCIIYDAAYTLHAFFSRGFANLTYLSLIVDC